MSHKSYSPAAKFKGQRGQGITGSNGAFRGQVDASNATGLQNRNGFDLPVPADFKANRRFHWNTQTAQSGLQPVFADSLLDSPDVPGIESVRPRARPPVGTNAHPKTVTGT